MLARWNAVSTWDRMLDDVMGSMVWTAKTARTLDPSVDVRASENEFVFVCDVPGVKREDIEVSLENRVLTIKGSRKFDGRENEQVVLERAYGSFNRAFTLPDSVDEASLTANLADGVLTVRIPKQAKAKPRKIEISNGSGSKELAG
jgi:HSP20 family protein